MVLVEEALEVESFSFQADLPEDRLCASCDEPIPLARLKAMPMTVHCVSCLESEGDVDLIKRYDDYIGRHGDEVVSTYYKGPNQYIDTAVKKLMTNNAYTDDPDEIRSEAQTPLINPRSLDFTRLAISLPGE